MPVTATPRAAPQPSDQVPITTPIAPPPTRPAVQQPPPLPNLTGHSASLSQRSSNNPRGRRGTIPEYGEFGSFGSNSSLFGVSHLGALGGSGYLGSSDSLLGPGSMEGESIEMLLKKSRANIMGRHFGGRPVKRVVTAGGITENSEENSEGGTATETEEEGPSELHILDEKLNFVIEMMFKNMKYTRAIYQSTKKSLSGPGFELAMLARDSTLGYSTGAHTRTGSEPRGSARSGEFRESASRQTVGRGSSQSQKVGNMLELTRYIMRRKENKSRRTEIGAQMWRFMEDRNSSRKAAVYSLLNHFLLAASVVMACVDVIDLSIGSDTKERAETWTRPVAIGIECAFAIELALRFAFCPHPRVFWLNRYNLIDAASALPVFIRIGTLLSSAVDTSDEVNAVLTLVPVLRLCKFLRRFESFHLLASAFVTSFQALPVVLFTLLLTGLSFAAVIYYVEPRSNVRSFAWSIWYVMVTMCGVAPGEPTPVTQAGKFFTVLLMLCGILYMAIPIGIVGSAFSEVWQERHRLLLLQRMRNCVERAGYTPDDLREMFKLLDEDHDGSLDFKEFSAMLDVMQIGVEEHFIGEVFASFDADCEGSIDFRELLRGLFPQSHHTYMEQQLSARSSLQDSFMSQARSTWSLYDARSIGRNADIQSSDQPGRHISTGSSGGLSPKKEVKLATPIGSPPSTSMGSMDTIPEPSLSSSILVASKKQE